MNIVPQNMEHYLNKIASFGFVVCSISEGRLDPCARFSIADPADGDQGLYIECQTLDELAKEFFELYAELA